MQRNSDELPPTSAAPGREFDEMEQANLSAFALGGLTVGAAVAGHKILGRRLSGEAPLEEGAGSKAASSKAEGSPRERRPSADELAASSLAPHAATEGTLPRPPSLGDATLYGSDTVIIAAYMLPLIVSRAPDGSISIEWDKERSITKKSMALPSRVIYVGCISLELEPIEQDECASLHASLYACPPIHASLHASLHASAPLSSSPLLSPPPPLRFPSLKRRTPCQPAHRTHRMASDRYTARHRGARALAHQM